MPYRENHYGAKCPEEGVVIDGFTFKFQKLTGTPDPHVKGKTVKVLLDGDAICYFTYWAFESCACNSISGLQALDWIGHTWNNPAKVKAVLRFLMDYIPNIVDYYSGKEILLLLSTAQKIQYKALVQHEWVKEIDSWANKSHGGNPVHMFRISEEKDFK